MGDTLSADDGVALFGMTAATAGILFVLIHIFGPVSGAHFNTVVSLAFFFKGEINTLQLLAYLPCQILGGILGTALAHVMFNVQELYSFNGPQRDSLGEFVSETVAVFGLLCTIIGCIYADKKDVIPSAVGVYICAG